MLPTIHVSILCDSRIFRDVISSRLITEDGIELLGAVSTVRDLLESGFAERTDVVLVHSTTDPADTSEATWEIKRLLPSVRLVAMGCRPNGPGVARTIEAGASACLEHGASYGELVDAIRAAAGGRATGSLEMLVEIGRRIDTLEAKEPSTESPPPKLSAREAQVARLVALGLVNKQIARRLGIRLSTAKNHVHNVLRKLQIERRRDLVGFV